MPDGYNLSRNTKADLSKREQTCCVDNAPDVKSKALMGKQAGKQTPQNR